jgi:TolA-binding protein
VVAISGLFAFGNDLAQQNRQRIMDLQRIVMEQNERIDGLTSLIEGLNAQIAALKQAQRHAPQSAEENDTVKLIEDLGKMIDEINKNYVSRQELQKILGTKGAPQTGTKKHTGKSATAEEQFSDTAPAKLYSEAVRLFVKKRYDEAKKRFLITAKKGYKPAASNYYLGEIAYYTKQYEDAIFYYKKSASLYDQAGYMDVLLLHTAIALDKTGEKEQARIFYENVIANYPDKKSAVIAKERLKGM